MKSSNHSNSPEKEAVKNTVLPRNAGERRRTRSRARASPGRGPLHNGLMNAAWPKSPKYPAVKPNDRSSSAASQLWNERKSISSIIDQVEDMEVDSHDNSVLLSSGASTELSLMRSKSETFSKGKHTNRQQLNETSTLEGKVLDKHNEENSNDKNASDETNRKLLVGKKKLGNASVSSQEDKTHCHDKKTHNEKPASKNPQVFIVLHVSRVDVGKNFGPATSPVKIYGDRIMIKMEDKLTSKDISCRIICRNIKQLKVNFKHRPFFMKMQVSKIQQVSSEKNSSRNGGTSEESVVLHLAYENGVPDEVRRSLKHLFKERLADLNLWKETDSDEDSPESDSNVNAISSQEDAKSKQCKVSDTDDTVTSPGGQKRAKTEQNTQNQKENARDIRNTRRSLSLEKVCSEDRIRSLESEAANYQLLLGQKRLEIQFLEQQLLEKEEEAQLAREEVLREIERKENSICELRSRLENFQIVMDAEKEKSKQAEMMISSMQKAIDENERVVKEHQQAILVRDNQLKEVRSTTGSPRKTNNEYTEEIRRIEMNLQQARSSLDETRRSKNSIREELRKTVSTMEDLRQQLRSERSRNRKLETEKSSDAQKLGDALSSKRLLLFQLNEEKARTCSLERELFNSRRRVENEENQKLEMENECQSLRSQIEQKYAVIQHLTSERDTAVTEVGILKREIHSLNEQGNAETINDNRNNVDGARSNQSEHTSNDWIIDRNEIILQDVVLGVGGWGNVKLGRFRGTDVAVKQIHHLILSSHNRRLFSREMSIASRCRHPCLLQFIGATCDDGTPLFVSEVLDSDLRTFLGLQTLTDKDTCLIALDVAMALNYLHKAKPMPIIHRDISSSNVLLWYKRNELHAKLSDYGAANFMRISMTQHPGAALYSAPETSSRNQTPKVDIFSFGVLLCEMLIRELPVIQQRNQQIQLIRNEDHRNLVNRCIKEEPERRPNACQLIEICRTWTLQQ